MLSKLGDIDISFSYNYNQYSEDFVGYDSKLFGPLPRGLVEGLVVAVIWPPERRRWLD